MSKKTDSINPDNITFKELKILKKKLEADIGALINAFQDTTGATVREISSRCTCVTVTGDGEPKTFRRVIVDAGI